jgi:hypothetical protein
MPKPFRHRTFRFRFCRISIVALTVAFLLVTPLALRAQDNQNPPAPPPDAVHQPVLRMSDVHGDVRVYRGDLLAFPKAFLNMPIAEGMRIVTGESGRAEIQFADGSVARLAPNSSLVVEHLDDSSDGIMNARLRALTGLTYYEFNTQGSQYTLAVGPETVVPQSNAVIRVDMDNTPYQVAAIQGDLQILDGTSFLTSLQSGQSVSLNPSDAYSYQVSDSIPPNSWDQWNSNRDATLADLASNGGYNSSDNAAWNELNAYGDWYNVPGYGEGWAPSGVGADWDPYGDGAWGYYPSWGYTWISGYPWGWWPYHCGYWNWFGGYGWVWFPGNCGWGGYGGGAWYPVSYIQSAPPHYHRLIRPVRPAHAPRHRVPRIYPVRRGNQFGGVFKPFHGSKPSPRPFQLNGKNLQPIRPALPSMQFAPVGGEGYTSRAAAAHPGGAANRTGGSQPVTRVPYPILNGGYPSGRANHEGGGARVGSSPRHAPFVQPRNNGGGINNSNQPSFHGPVFRPAPRPNPGPRPGPVFHPAPMPRPVPMPRPQPMPHPTFQAAPHPAFHPAPHPQGRPHP